MPSPDDLMWRDLDASHDEVTRWGIPGTETGDTLCLSDRLAVVGAEIERLRTLVNEHHCMNHWMDGTEAQRRVAIAQLGVECAVCNALGGVRGRSREQAGGSDG